MKWLEKRPSLDKLLTACTAVFLPFGSARVFAHCPLCTAGAGAATAAAALLGVKYGAIGVLIGGFATALSLWLVNLVKKRYFAGQKQVLFAVIFLATVLPIIPFAKDYTPIYLALAGEQGSWLNRTYLINWFVVGLIIGAVTVAVAPLLSQSLKTLRKGKSWRWQGLSITMVLLILAAALMQLLT